MTRILIEVPDPGLDTGFPPAALGPHSGPYSGATVGSAVRTSGLADSRRSGIMTEAPTPKGLALSPAQAASATLTRDSLRLRRFGIGAECKKGVNKCAPFRDLRDRVFAVARRQPDIIGEQHRCTLKKRALDFTPRPADGGGGGTVIPHLSVGPGLCLHPVR